MLKLYNKEHEAIGVLTNLKDYKVEYVLSGEDLVEFSLSISDENIHLVEEEGYVRNKSNEYVIKAIDPSDNFKRFTCNVNVEGLVGKAIASFDTSNNNINDTIRLAIAGTGWILADNNINKRRTVRLTNTNALEVLREVRKVFSVDFRYDAINKKIYVYEKFGEDKGVYFSDELNLKSLSIPSDTYDYVTRLYPYGKDGLTIAEINNGKDYIENFQYSNKIIELIWQDNRYTDVNSLKEDAEAKLEELSKPNRSYQASVTDLAKQSKEYSYLDFFLGDTVTLLSKSEKFRDKQRIVKYIEYPDNPSENTCELGNTILTFEELQQENEYKNQTVDNITTGNGIINGEAIDGISTEQIYDFEAEVAKITDLTVINADITNLKAENVTITGKLSAIEGEFGTLKANVATIEELTVTHSASINDLQANKANITDLTATNIKFNVASGGTLDLQTLLSKFVTGENGQFINISSSNSVIANATIKNAMIESLSVDKLLAGRISTNKFTVSSDDGGIEIVGATQQFKDKNNKVRIQMGQDTQGNFNFILRGEDGTTTLIDHNGIKEKAIADDLIKENMVAADAIGEKQINYSSLITGLNKDTNTQLIKASKVAIDLTGQSLEVSFNSLKSNVDNMEIGGRNLIIDTKEMKWCENATSETYKGFVVAKGTASSTSYKDIFAAPTIDNVTSTQYTVSFYAKSSTSSSIRCYFYNPNTTVKAMSSTGQTSTSVDGQIYVTLTTEWKRYWVTWTQTVPSSLSKKQVIIGRVTSGGDVSICGVKFEEGNKATDWTPAPEDVDQKIESNTTAITVAQGKIEGLISENTIIKGDVTTISDKYTSLKATVDGINTTVASHTSSIGTISTDLATANALADSKAKVFTSIPTTPYKVGDLWVQGTSGEIMKCKTARASGSYVASDWEKASKYTDDTKANAVEGNLNTLSGKVTIVENNYASLSQDLSGFKTTVGNTYSTKSELSSVDGKVTSLTSRVSTAESSITQLNNKIALKVEATDVIEAINNIEVGGRNYIEQGNFEKTDKWTSLSGTKEYQSKICGYRSYNGTSEAFITSKRYFYTELVGKNITLSFLGAKTSNMKSFEVHILSRKSGTSSDYTYVKTQSFNLTDTLQKHSFTYTMPSDIDSFYIRFDNNGSTNGSDATLYITDVKLEEGNKPTDWTPALEDVENDATTKANNAQTNAKNYTDGQITIVNKTITDKVAEIKLTTDSITQRVSSTEFTTSTLTNKVNTAQNTADSANSKIDSLKLGSMNIYPNSNFKNNISTYEVTTDTTISYYGGEVDNNSSRVKGRMMRVYSSTGGDRFITDKSLMFVESGQQYTVSFDYFTSERVTGSSSYLYFYDANEKLLTSGQFLNLGITSAGGRTFRRLVKTFTVPSSAKYCRIRYGFVCDGACWMTVDGVSIVKGNKDIGWSPSPEDINSAITTVDTKVETTNNKVASIETNLNSITSRVGTVESKQTTVNGKVSSLETRMSTAESKITETAITNVVSKGFYSKNDIDSKGYQTSSQVQQTVNQLEVKFSTNGGYNLIYNGNFERGLEHWTLTNASQGYIWVKRNDNGSPNNPLELFMQGVLDGENRYATQGFDWTSNEALTLSWYQWTSLGGGDGSNVYRGTQVTITYTDGTKSWHTSGNQTELNVWQKRSMTIYPEYGKRVSWISVDAWCRDTSKATVYTDIMLEKGVVATNWTPNPNEVVDGIIILDKNGVKVSHSNGDYTQLHAEGLKRYRSNGDAKGDYHYLTQYVGFSGQDTIWVQLKDDFKGKHFTAYSVISDTWEDSWNHGDPWVLQRFVTYVETDNIDYANARVPVLIYRIDKNYKTGEYRKKPCAGVLLVVA